MALKSSRPNSGRMKLAMTISDATTEIAGNTSNSLSWRNTPALAFTSDQLRANFANMTKLRCAPCAASER
jgi:ribosome-binding factor A